MKRLFIYICLILAVDVLASAVLRKEENLPRDKEKVIRTVLLGSLCQDMFTDSVWDISNVNVGHRTNVIRYRFANDTCYSEMKNGHGHYFVVNGSKIMMLKDAEPGTVVKFHIPETVMDFNATGAGPIDGYYYGEGVFSTNQHLRIAGNSSYNVIGHGKLITPDGDVLPDATAVKYFRIGTLATNVPSAKSFAVSRDSSLFSADSISGWLNTDSIIHSIESLRIYARGYRYPIVETSVTKTYLYGEAMDSLREAWYCSPSFQRYELDEDIANDTIRIAYDYAIPPNVNMMSYGSGRSGSGDVSAQDFINDNQPSNPSDGIADDFGTVIYGVSCDISPRVVSQSTRMTITAPHPYRAEISIVNSAGKLMRRQQAEVTPGNNAVDIDMSEFVAGYYLVTIGINNKELRYKVIKATG